MLVDPDGAPGLLRSDVVEAIETAFSNWSEPACSGVDLRYDGIATRAAALGDGINTIEWVEAGWEHGADSAGVTDVQYERSDGGDWYIAEADIYLNAQHHSWRLNGAGSDSERDVVSVVTHEVGHVLGLLHPCELDGEADAPDCAGELALRGATMYPAYSAEQASLSEDDEAGACFLYPREDCTTGGCAEGLECIDARCVTTCGGALCEPDEVCVDDRCVPYCSVEPCRGGARCDVDDHCESGFRCIAGSCARAETPLGDPCSTSRQCESGACHPDGYCAQPCGAESCAVQDRCIDGLDGVLTCAAGQRQFGETCGESNDCLGGECADGLGDRPFCTRLCGADRLVCPKFWTCHEIDDRRVCVPPTPGGGCVVAPARPPTNVWGSLVALGAGLLAARLRRHYVGRLFRSNCRRSRNNGSRTEL